MPDTLTTLHRRINRLDRRVAALGRRYKADGWMLPIVCDAHRFGGGRLVWAFDGHSVHAHGHNSIWTENNIDASNYRAATYGGPNVTLDGSAEYLSIADAAWQETGAEELLVWGWGWLNDPLPGGQACLASKFYTTGPSDNRSWKLRFDASGTTVAFDVSPDGTVANQVTVTGTYTVLVETWYFIAGYFKASTVMNVYIGANTDAQLTKATLAVSIPATAYDGSAALVVGANASGASYWDGRIGKVMARSNVPSTDVDGHVGMLFAMTRDAYEE